MFLAIAIAVPFLALTAAILWYTGQTHRLGGAPHCFNCDFDLTGGPTTECTRCGVPIPLEKMRFGRHDPLRGRIRIGQGLVGVVILLCGVLAWETFQRLQSQWYFVRPTWLIMGDLSDDHLRWRAARELAHRSRLGNLPVDRSRQAADIILAWKSWEALPEQVHRQGLNCLGQLYLNGQLDRDQVTQIFEFMDATSIIYRPDPSGNGGTILLTGLVRAPDNWAPLRQIEVLSADMQSINEVIHEGYDLPEITSGGCEDRPIPSDVQALASMTVRVTTRWYNFDVIPFHRELNKARGPDREALIRKLKLRKPVFVHGYTEQLRFAYFKGYQSQVIERTGRTTVSQDSAPAESPATAPTRPAQP